MAAVRDRARLQHLEFVGNKRLLSATAAFQNEPYGG